MKSAILIPARLKSTRLPNKIILDICGKPMIQWVYEQVIKSQYVDSIYIVTDSLQIADIVENFGGMVIFTSPNHQSGTDRIAEAIEKIDNEIIINVQGDEPLIDFHLIDKLILELKNRDSYFVSAMSKIENIEELQNPNIVKVIQDINSYAIYFSRSPIPFNRDGNIDISQYKKHIGIYGYKRDFLKQYSSLSPTFLEQSEKLEQLRAIEHGFKIKMVDTTYKSIGVDTIEDLERVRKIICGNLSS